MPKRYSKEYKQKVIQACQEGVPIHEVSQSNSIAVSTIYRWIKEAEAEVPIPGLKSCAEKERHRTYEKSCV